MPTVIWQHVITRSTWASARSSPPRAQMPLPSPPVRICRPRGDPLPTSAPECRARRGRPRVRILNEWRRSVARYGDLYVNDVTGEWAVVLRGDEDAPDEPMLVHLRVSPGGAVSGEHLHPALQERFRVLDGVLETKVDGARRTLRAGEEVTVAPGLWHDWWNASEEPVDVLIELSPPSPRFEMAIATGFGLANAGRTNDKG